MPRRGGDLVDAFTTCGRLTAACLANHGHAENRSLISGRTVFTGTPCVAGYVSVLSCSLPSSLGGDPSGLPSWASWILDQVEGFVWPDADTDRLRAAAAAWRAASFQVADLSAYCSSAIRSFSLLRSPEVPVAVEVTSGLADRCRAVGDQCAVLARACDTYADHVDEQRAAILDLVQDLLRDAVIIEGIGIVLGTLTVGATAAGATALNAARIAATAPRLLRIIATLRTLASTCAAPLRFAATALRDVRARARGLPPGSDHGRFGVQGRARGPRRDGCAVCSEIPRLFDPNELRGLSRRPTSNRCARVGRCATARGVEGIVHDDTSNYGRQIRVMDGYPPGSRPDPITGVPTLRSLRERRHHQDPATREPACDAEIIAHLLEEMEEYLDACDDYPLYQSRLVSQRGRERRPKEIAELAQQAYDEFTSRHFHQGRLVPLADRLGAGRSADPALPSTSTWTRTARSTARCWCSCRT